MSKRANGIGGTLEGAIALALSLGLVPACTEGEVSGAGLDGGALEADGVGSGAEDGEGSGAGDGSGEDARLGDGEDARPFDAETEDDALRQVCPPGVVGCVGGGVIVCNADGSAFELTTCEEGLLCSEGACVECASEDDCGGGEACSEEGTCEVSPLLILTESIPPALEGASYEEDLEASGGVSPYEWTITSGGLPPGFDLSLDGHVSGTAGAPGVFPFIVRCKDAAGEKTQAALTLDVLESGLHVATPSPLPTATDGEPYSFTLKAVGGTAPYFWGLSGGALPPGITLGAGGVLAGVPEGDGSYEFSVKVFDDGASPLVDEADLLLPVTIAPLEITSTDPPIDLLLTKLITLPLIIVVDGLPVPYGAQLLAKGGKKPYHWAEEPLPGFVQGFLPQAGLPDGLVLAEDGSISGAVTDASLVISIDLFGVKLSGFFFAARVEDSQPVADEATAVYIIPTVPIGGP